MSIFTKLFQKKSKSVTFTGKPLNGAIIGFGGMGHYHADQLKKLPFLNFYGVYDIDEKRLEEARSCGVKAFSSAEELFADKNVDFVVIVTPNDVHAPYVIQAAKAGKNIVCEKPVTLNPALFADMVKAVEECGVKFMVHQNRRWDSDFLAAMNIFNNGQIGRVYHVESCISASNGIANDWRSVRKYGGGMLFDWGIHQIDQIMFMNKAKVVAVDADVSYRQNYDADDGFTLRLYFENGDTAYIKFDTNDFVGVRRWHMFGEEGTAGFDWGSNGNVVRVKDKVDSNILPVQIGNGLSKTIAPRSKHSVYKSKVKHVSSGWESFYNHYYDYVVNGAEPYIKMSENMRVMQVVEAAFRSSEEHQRINVDI